MKVTTEAYFPKIAVDNQIMDAIRNKQYSVRIGFKDENDFSRYEVCLTEQEARNLMENINIALFTIDKAKKELNID